MTLKIPYPPDWDALAYQVKADANWQCERCGHKHEPSTGYTLTTHHLDHNQANRDRRNLAALCQRCHLHFQQPIMKNPWLLLAQETFLGINEDWLLTHIPPALYPQIARYRPRPPVITNGALPGST